MQELYETIANLYRFTKKCITSSTKPWQPAARPLRKGFAAMKACLLAGPLGLRELRAGILSRSGGKPELTVAEVRSAIEEGRP